VKMAMARDDKLKQIEDEAEELLQHFVRDLSGLPRCEETYYDSAFPNMVRREGTPRRRRLFRRLFLSNAPRVDGKGHILTESASWSRAG